MVLRPSGDLQSNIMEQSLVLQLLVAAVLVGSVYPSPTVTIAQGSLVGHIYNTTYGAYYAFQGIPYAKPPVGELRFKAPVPAEPWNGTFQAVQEGPTCMQLDTGTGAVTGNEDCLFVNVYTAQLPDPDNLLPVMVWIHGGGYFIGSGNRNRQDPVFLVNDGVVYVSLNYRLTVFGFLSTQDEAAPGNMGMKDQVLALRWVQQNIAAFGGDPEQVTIFGESAGGASVSLQVVSPMAAGLFRAAISESGSSVNGWSLRDKEDARLTAFYIGNALGYTGNSSQELVDFLRTISAEDLIKAVIEHVMEFDAYRLIQAVFVPVPEPELEGEEAFLPDSPVNLLAQGRFNDVAVLTGTNSGESLGFLGIKGMLDGSATPEEIDRNFSLIFKPELRYCRHEPCGDQMLARMKSFYFGNQSVTSDNLQNLVDLATDLFFAEGVMYAVDKISTLGTKPVYFYEFTYEGAFSSKAGIPGAANYSGVPHADELPYVFDYGVEAAAGSTDALVQSEMAALWTNFAKIGNPTPDGTGNLPAWLPYSSSATNYLNIDAQLSLKTDFNKARMEFWRELYEST